MGTIPNLVVHNRENFDASFVTIFVTNVERQLAH